MANLRTSPRSEQPDDFCLELRHTHIGPNDEPLYSLTGRLCGTVAHDARNITAAEVREYVREVTNNIRRDVRGILPEIDTLAEVA
jgi:hypothetical protein